MPCFRSDNGSAISCNITTILLLLDSTQLNFIIKQARGPKKKEKNNNNKNKIIIRAAEIND